MSNLTQKRHPYTGNLIRERFGDSKNVFLHCGYVLEAGCTGNKAVPKRMESGRML